LILVIFKRERYRESIIHQTTPSELTFPKIIHQTAPSDKSKWHPIWEPCQASWKKHFPDYEYKFWSDEDLEELIATKYPWFLDTYKGYDKTIKRVDAARYFIMYEYGGIYADMDFECIKNFEHMFPKNKVSIAESPFKNEKRKIRETHQNALMISPKGHPFWKTTFDLLKKNKDHPDILFATGPYIIIRAIEQKPYDVFTLASEKFSPAHDATFRHVYAAGIKTMQSVEDPNIVSRHHGTTVWV
jgi:mannosyltransferase OCH1-like enzyme